jgi:hypothetical protein
MTVPEHTLLTEIAAELEREGVQAFQDSHDELLDCVGARG